MRFFRRIFFLIVLAVFIAPPILIWKYPGPTYRFIQKTVEKYRTGIEGRLVIAEGADWETIDHGLDRRKINVLRGDEIFGVTLTAVRFDPKFYDLKVLTIPLDKINQTSITSLAGTTKAQALINGSFFNEELGILGLAVSDGKTVSRMTVAGENRGIFFVKNEKARLVHRDRFSVSGTTQALQSGPWLVSEGKPQTTFKHPEKLNRRSAVCTDDKGRVLFVITDTAINGITMPHLAKVLAAPGPKGFGCYRALNLDGGTSSQMVLWNGETKMLVRGFVNVPVYIAAFAKEVIQ